MTVWPHTEEKGQDQINLRYGLGLFFIKNYIYISDDVVSRFCVATKMSNKE